MKRITVFIGSFICIFLLGSNVVYGMGDPEDYLLSEKAYVLLLVRNGDSLTLDEQSVANGSYGYFQSLTDINRNGYNAVIFSFLGNVLGYFQISTLETVLCTDYIENGKMRGGCEFVGTDGKYWVNAPYFPNAHYIDVYDPSGKKLGRLDVSPSALCNENNQCDLNESHLECPTDCKEEEEIKKQSTITEEHAKEDTINESFSQQRSSIWAWVALIAIVLVIVVFIGLAVRAIRNRRKFDSFEEDA